MVGTPCFAHPTDFVACGPPSSPTLRPGAPPERRRPAHRGAAEQARGAAPSVGACPRHRSPVASAARRGRPAADAEDCRRPHRRACHAGSHRGRASAWRRAAVPAPPIECWSKMNRARSSSSISTPIRPISSACCLREAGGSSLASSNPMTAGCRCRIPTTSPRWMPKATWRSCLCSSRSIHSPPASPIPRCAKSSARRLSACRRCPNGSTRLGASGMPGRLSARRSAPARA